MLGLFNHMYLKFSKPVHPDVFVLGNQKSGTTVIAAAIAECAGVQAALDLHPIHTRRMTNAYVKRTLSLPAIIRRCRWRFNLPVVKEPILTFYANELAQSFPAARFVLIVRDPRDNIRSILNRLELPGNRACLTARQMAKLPAPWREVIENRRLGFSYDNHIESLAQRWLVAQRAGQLTGNRVLVVRYEDFLAGKTDFIRDLTARLGLPTQARKLKCIDRQFQSRGDRGVAWPVFFGKNLSVINEVCGSALVEHGYDLQGRRAA